MRSFSRAFPREGSALFYPFSCNKYLLIVNCYLLLALSARSALRQLLGGGILHAGGVHADGDHHLRLLGHIVHHVAGRRGDAIHLVHTLQHHTEGGILTVQMGGILMHDEELAACAVGDHGTSHAENAAGVLKVVLETVGGELALAAVAGAAHAVAVGAAALNHKAVDAAVENEAVIVAGIGQLNEVIHALRRHVGIELGHDLSAGLHFDGCNGIVSHGDFLLYV